MIILLALAFIIAIALLVAVPAFLAVGLDALIPFDVLTKEVAVGFGVTAGAIILLAAAVLRPKSDYWGMFVGFGTITMLFWSDALSTFMFTAVWTLFAGGVVGEATHRLKEIKEALKDAEEEENRFGLGRAALAAGMAGLAQLSFPTAFLVPIETSFFGESLPFLLGALLLAQTALSCRLRQRFAHLGFEFRDAYSASAFMPLFSVFIIARRYFEAPSSPPVSEAILWAALIAASIALIALFYPMEKRAKSAEQASSEA